MKDPRLDKYRALGTLTGNRLHPSARLVQDSGSRIRVGDAFSPVSAGDPTPTGGFYRAGQYSPHLDDLAVNTFSSAKNAGILPSNIPIFDENGDVDKDKLNAWHPSSLNMPVSFADDLPVYSSAVVASSLLHVNPNLLSGLNTSIMQAPRFLGQFGNYIIGAKANIDGGVFSSQLYVYPDYYKFIDKPIVPKSPKRETGLSVSSFMTFHALGHILLSRISFQGRLDEVSKFLDSSGWSKNSTPISERGWFMGRESPLSWYRSKQHNFLSELSRYSPMDDFAQAFAFYHTSNEYFQKIDPDKYEIMHALVTEKV